jgi:hypothetical protein
VVAGAVAVVGTGVAAVVVLGGAAVVDTDGAVVVDVVNGAFAVALVIAESLCSPPLHAATTASSAPTKRHRGAFTSS